MLDLTRPVAAQAIVILSGGEFRDWAPEYGGPDARGPLLERVAATARMSRGARGLPVLVSGTQREVLAMRATLARDFGIEVHWVEGESRDTFPECRVLSRGC